MAPPACKSLEAGPALPFEVGCGKNRVGLGIFTYDHYRSERSGHAGKGVVYEGGELVRLRDAANSRDSLALRVAGRNMVKFSKITPEPYEDEGNDASSVSGEAALDWGDAPYWIADGNARLVVREIDGALVMATHPNGGVQSTFADRVAGAIENPETGNEDQVWVYRPILVQARVQPDAADAAGETYTVLFREERTFDERGRLKSFRRLDKCVERAGTLDEDSCFKSADVRAEYAADGSAKVWGRDGDITGDGFLTEYQLNEEGRLANILQHLPLPSTDVKGAEAVVAQRLCYEAYAVGGETRMRLAKIVTADATEASCDESNAAFALEIVNFGYNEHNALTTTTLATPRRGDLFDVTVSGIDYQPGTLRYYQESFRAPYAGLEQAPKDGFQSETILAVNGENLVIEERSPSGSISYEYDAGQPLRVYEGSPFVEGGETTYDVYPLVSQRTVGGQTTTWKRHAQVDLGSGRLSRTERVRAHRVGLISETRPANSKVVTRHTYNLFGQEKLTRAAGDKLASETRTFNRFGYVTETEDSFGVKRATEFDAVTGLPIDVDTTVGTRLVNLPTDRPALLQNGRLDKVVLVSGRTVYPHYTAAGRLSGMDTQLTSSRRTTSSVVYSYENGHLTAVERTGPSGRPEGSVFYTYGGVPFAADAWGFSRTTQMTIGDPRKPTHAGFFCSAEECVYSNNDPNFDISGKAVRTCEAPLPDGQLPENLPSPQHMTRVCEAYQTCLSGLDAADCVGVVFADASTDPAKGFLHLCSDVLTQAGCEAAPALPDISEMNDDRELEDLEWADGRSFVPYHDYTDIAFRFVRALDVDGYVNVTYSSRVVDEIEEDPIDPCELDPDIDLDRTDADQLAKNNSGQRAGEKIKHRVVRPEWTVAEPDQLREVRPEGAPESARPNVLERKEAGQIFRYTWMAGTQRWESNEAHDRDFIRFESFEFDGHVGAQTTYVRHTKPVGEQDYYQRIGYVSKPWPGGMAEELGSDPTAEDEEKVFAIKEIERSRELGSPIAESTVFTYLDPEDVADTELTSLFMETITTTDHTTGNFEVTRITHPTHVLSSGATAITVSQTNHAGERIAPLSSARVGLNATGTSRLHAAFVNTPSGEQFEFRTDLMGRVHAFTDHGDRARDEGTDSWFVVLYQGSTGVYTGLLHNSSENAARRILDLEHRVAGDGTYQVIARTPFRGFRGVLDPLRFDITQLSQMVGLEYHTETFAYDTRGRVSEPSE